MNKKQLKQVMLEVLDGFNDYNKDEWYVTDREVAEFGIKALAEQLNIDLTEELEQQKDTTVLTVAQLKSAARCDTPIHYRFEPYDPEDETINYVGPINDTQSDGYYGLSRDEIFDLDSDPCSAAIFETDVGVDTYYVVSAGER